MTAAEEDAFLHSWQVAIHLLGVRDEFIPQTWAAADAQSAQVLTPILAPTPEGKELAEDLLGLTAQIDLGVTRGFLNEFVRYVLSDAIGDWLQPAAATTRRRPSSAPGGRPTSRSARACCPSRPSGSTCSTSSSARWRCCSSTRAPRRRPRPSRSRPGTGPEDESRLPQQTERRPLHGARGRRCFRRIRPGWRSTSGRARRVRCRTRPDRSTACPG